MQDRFWEALSAGHGIVRDRPETWTVESPRHLRSLKRSGAFNPMATDRVRRALDDLLGAARWNQPTTWGLPLVTFAAPDAGWNLPATGWHAGREPGRVARYLEEGSTIDGRRFRVQELTGSPGDVILMHPRTLHAPAPNSRPGPRMMLVEIIGRLAGVR